MKKKEKQYYKSPMTDIVRVEVESLLAAESPDSANPMEPFDPAGSEIEME